MRASTAVVIIVLCVAAGIFILMRRGREDEAARDATISKVLTRFWYCEPCDKEFLAEGGADPWAICPKCDQKTTIVREKRWCKNCKHEFVRFECDAPTSRLRPLGGYWGEDFDTNAPCPQCGSKDLISLPGKK